MSLYNAKSAGHNLRITKFDADLNPEPNATYLTSPTECTCPAGNRATCRHRKMYHHLQEIADTSSMWDYERGIVVPGPEIET